MKEKMYAALLVGAMCAGVLNSSADNYSLEKGPNSIFCGRIVDSESNVLPGATIFLKGIGQGSISDVNGFYRIANLKPGTYTVVVTYVGYVPQEFAIQMRPGETKTHNITLKEGLELQEVVVGGALTGQRKALNAQKQKMGVVNIVSADQVGKFPDSNIGDALKRISGINVQYDQGEARFGQVRGTSPDMTAVTVNGNRLPSAEGDVRNVQLDLIPSDMVQTIEVNKVVTADMDGDAIGGAVNLITKNTPYKRVLTTTVGSGYNVVSAKPQLNAGLTWGNRFFQNKLGIMFGLSYQNAPAGSDNVEFEYERDKETGKVFLTNAETRQYFVTRQRQSYSLSLDYDITPNHKLTFKSIYNRRYDWENRYRVSYKDLDTPHKMAVTLQTKAGASNNRNARLELQQTMDFALGGEHQFGRLGIDWGISYAQASEDRPEERYMRLKSKGYTFEVADDGERFPYVTNRLQMNESKWDLDELINSSQHINETDRKLKLNFILPLSKGTLGNKLYWGAKYTYKSKHKDIVSNDYVEAYKDRYGVDYKQYLQEQLREGFMPGKNYQSLPFIRKEYIGAMDLSKLTPERAWEESSGNFDASEQITAAYVRLDQQLGKQHQLVLGLRMEKTDLTYAGWNWQKNEKKEESLEPTGTRSNSYVNWLPSLLYKWEISDKNNVKVSYTQTLARPKYSALVPSIYLDMKDNELTIGNSNLAPTRSYNFDVSFEHYFQSVGLVSVGVFAKQLTDFIVEQRTSGSYGAYPNIDFKKITQAVNAGNASLIGAEFAFQRDLGFLSPSLRHWGIYGNYTYTHSEVSNFNFEGRENEFGLSLPGSPKHSANVSLAYEKKGLLLRASYNYASSFIDEMGEHADLDRYYDAVNYLDLNAAYTWGKRTKMTVYVEATNLLNQPLRYYQGVKNRTMQVEYYGMRWNAGIKINL